jgi:hypothetical protein
MKILPHIEKGCDIAPITKDINLEFSLTPSNKEIVIVYDNKVIASLSVTLAVGATEKAAGFFLEFDAPKSPIGKNIAEVEANLYKEE